MTRRDRLWLAAGFTAIALLGGLLAQLWPVTVLGLLTGGWVIANLLDRIDPPAPEMYRPTDADLDEVLRELGAHQDPREDLR